MRLFDGEVRAVSRTGWAVGASFTTQASNFSFLRRSLAVPDRMTLSIPNCRKQSVKRPRTGSFRSTRAALAEDFLPLLGRGETAVPMAFSIGSLIPALQDPLCIPARALAKANKDSFRVPRSHYLEWTGARPE